MYFNPNRELVRLDDRDNGRGAIDSCGKLNIKLTHIGKYTFFVFLGGGDGQLTFYNYPAPSSASPS